VTAKVGLTVGAEVTMGAGVTVRGGMTMGARVTARVNAMQICRVMSEMLESERNGRRSAMMHMNKFMRVLNDPARAALRRIVRRWVVAGL
jgi:hypothetical protein